ncbi:carbohydrate-binding module family 48 protein [Poronia punctata]|nr:carbohydrate-binding module family 48 protein [Poronia punctata]
MGSFVFKWDHPATDVYVTGTFDDWKKSEKLEKVGDSFEKKVTLPDASSKIYYKFVVDGEWVTDHTAAKEIDGSGIENNVLTPEQIVSEAPETTAIMSSAAPESTTAALAADAPLENREREEEQDKSGDQSNLPGTFPETPAAEQKDDNAFSVNPLPAAPGGVNPFKLAPGQEIPEDVAAASTTEHVKLDPESYEKSDTLPGGLPAAFSSAAPTATTATLAADAPIESKVPEVVKESQERAGADPEASEIAEEVEEKAAVEKELLEKVKEAPSTAEGTAGVGTEKTEHVVTPGEAAASVAAAASAVAGAALVGATAAKDAALDTAHDSVAAAQAAAASAAAQLSDSVKDIKLPESVQSAIGGTTKEEVREEASPEVPAEVKESITEAGKSPEAAANTEAVEDKRAMEAELLHEVDRVDAAGDAPVDVSPEPEIPEQVSSAVPAAVKESFAEAGESPEAATNTDAVVEKKTVENELLREVKPVDGTGAEEEVSSSVPAAVQESIAHSGMAPAAATNTDAVVEKKTVEEELLKEVKPTEAISSEPAKEEASNTTEAPKIAEAPAATEAPAAKDTPVKAVPATTEAPGTSVAAATTETPAVAAAKAADARSKKPEVATNGNKASENPTTPSKPTEEGTPSSSKATDSPSTTDKKKKHRLSAMFGKVKAKLAHKQ